MARFVFLSLAVLLGWASAADAQRFMRPPRPNLPGIFPGPPQWSNVSPHLPLPWPGVQPQVPLPLPQGSAFDGRWFFRGDPTKPAFIQTVATIRGQQVILTNENGTPAMGWVSHDGRRVTVPDWRLVGTLRRGGRVLVWPNGDFWAR